MPFSRSRSLESITRSLTVSLERNAPRLLQQGVDERGLSVVDVCDDREVAKVGAMPEFARVGRCGRDRDVLGGGFVGCSIFDSIFRGHRVLEKVQVAGRHDRPRYRRFTIERGEATLV